MALKKIYIGSVGPFLYDDTDLVNDLDGDFAGEDYRTIVTDGQIRVEQAPGRPKEVLRLEDLDYRILPPVSVANVDNPTELNALAGGLGSIVLAYEIVGATGQNEYTLYAYDASGPGVNSPYVVDADGAGDERWIAIAGKYAAQGFSILGNIALTGTIDGVDLAAFAAAYVAHIANVNAHHAQIHLVSSHSDTQLAGIANNDLWQWNDPATVWIPKSIQEIILNQNINPGNITMNDDAWIGIGALLERIIFDAAGDISFMGCKVGIGTAGPGRKLHIIDSTGVVPLQVESGVAGAFVSFRDDTSGGNTSVRVGAEANDLAFWAGNIEKMRLDSDGNVGIDNTDPTLPLDVKAKSGMTTIGGFAIKLTNKTGVNSVAGQVVKADTANNDAVILTGVDEQESIAVFLESGVADGDEAWVVISGIADVAMEDNTLATHGNWVYASAEAGYANATLLAPPGGGVVQLDQHMQEIGHCIESVAAGGAGTHILARCVLHFN